MNAAAFLAVKAPDQQRGSVETCDGFHPKVDDIVVRQKRPESQRRQVFVFHDVRMTRRRELGDMRTQLTRPRRAENAVFLDDRKLRLNTRNRRPGGENGHFPGIVFIKQRLGQFARLRVDDRHGSRAVEAESQKQFEPGRLAAAEETALGALEPAFGNQVVEKRMQSARTRMRLGTDRQRMGDRGTARVDEAAVVDKLHAAVRLLAQEAREDVSKIDLAPKQFRHG